MLDKYNNILTFLHSDAESFDSGMSLTNTIDMKHTEPEFKVFVVCFFVCLFTGLFCSSGCFGTLL